MKIFLQSHELFPGAATDGDHLRVARPSRQPTDFLVKSDTFTPDIIDSNDITKCKTDKEASWGPV